MRNRQFLRILARVVLESNGYFAGKTEIDTRWSTAKLEESYEYFGCGLVNESSEPPADVVDVVALEYYVVEDQLSCQFFVACSEAPELCVSDPFFEDAQLQNRLKTFPEGYDDLSISLSQ